jgi:hypothetical protein
MRAAAHAPNAATDIEVGQHILVCVQAVHPLSQSHHVHTVVPHRQSEERLRVGQPAPDVSVQCTHDMLNTVQVATHCDAFAKGKVVVRATLAVRLGDVNRLLSRQSWQLEPRLP